MDEISRELPDPAPRMHWERSRGPEELQAFERGQMADNLVVNDADDGRRRGAAREPEDPGRDDATVPSDREPGLRRGRRKAQPDEVPDAPVDPASAGLDDEVDPAHAAAAAAAGEEVAEIEDDLVGEEDGEGLPAVPELSDAKAVAKIVFVLMLTSREGLSMLRLAQACNTTQKIVEEALLLLQEELRGLGLPVELARAGDTVKWMSGQESFPYLQRLRGVKRLEKLSTAALETLAVIAYRQPVMRSEIEAIRGVKAGPMLRTLLQHKLVKVTGRADVPGRPLQYGTTQQFLERFGIASLQELPSVKEWKNLG
ncbi:MAG TPA: SMC-Scp complex subunit ScpB [Planctomycetota bacterium]|nr:SMC-Scp complex subunit ScpB [Planctomycetota bacterium]